MYDFSRSKQFKKDVKRCVKQNKNMEKYKKIHEMLIQGISLPLQNKDHNLTGNWVGYRECHIEPDWLVIYKVDEGGKRIEYTRMGSHAELF